MTVNNYIHIRRIIHKIIFSYLTISLDPRDNWDTKNKVECWVNAAHLCRLVACSEYTFFIFLGEERSGGWTFLFLGYTAFTVSVSGMTARPGPTQQTTQREAFWDSHSTLGLKKEKRVAKQDSTLCKLYFCLLTCYATSHLFIACLVIFEYILKQNLH